MMNTLLDPILGLDTEFPENVFVLHHPNSKRYGCYCHLGVHGLACFTTNNGAIKFGEFIDLDGLTVKQMSFDEAREVAKERPLPVTALMLLDNMSDPKVHFIR
jgi:hypothetical protein